MSISVTKSRQPTHILALAACLMSGICVGFAVGRSLLVGYALLALPFVALVALTVFKRPLRALSAFILILPIHSLAMTILIAQMRLPSQFVRVAAAWKETLLIGTFIAVAVRLLVERRSVPVTPVDWIALLWTFQVLFYLLFHEVLFDWQSGLTTRLYGARDWFVYLLPYFIGRLVSVSRKGAQRLLKAILAVGAITSAIGIFEYFFIPIRWYVALGVPRYFGEFLGLSYPAYLFGLPANYWVRIAGHLVRRAVSTHLSGQGFALSFLIIMPVAVYARLAKMVKHSRLVLFLCGAALLLTITRMTIVVCTIQALVLLWLFHRKRQVFQILAIMLLALGLAMLASPAIRSFVIDTVTLQDASARNRPRQWMQGLAALWESPLGLGLGSTGQAGARFGSTKLAGTTESGYFMITGALGLPGLLLWLSWFLGIVIYSYHGYQRFGGIWQGVAVVTLIVAIGFALNNLTAPPGQSPFVVYIFGWLAGLTVQRVESRLS